MNQLKSKFFIALLTVVLVVSGAVTAFALVVDQDFTLVNRTGESIVSIFLSPTSANNWRAEDELGDYILKNNYEVEIEFSPWDDARYWDIRAEFEDGSYAEWYKFDLFSVSKITLNRNGEAIYE